MEQNKLQSYIWYALGEILLVVIGILIAIQVSNWNEDRILRQSARYHLSLLTQDLAEDRALLTELISNYEMHDVSVKRLLSTLKRNDDISEVLYQDLVSLQFEYNFYPRKSALELLVNTGEIGALDVKAQDLISQYYRSVDALKERDLITNTFIQSKYEPYLFDRYSQLYGKGNTLPIIAEIYMDDQRDSLRFDHDKFLNDKKMEALLVARMYQNSRLTELYNKSLVNLKELMAYIDGLGM